MATLEVARQIEGQMQRAGVKRSQLAERLGKSRAWISKLLHGGQNVTVFTLVEVADALGFDLEVRLKPRLVQVRPAQEANARPRPTRALVESVESDTLALEADDVPELVA